jgi:hypothetical protein
LPPPGGKVALPVGGITIDGSGTTRTIESALHEHCDDDPDQQDPGCCEQHQSYNAAIDGIESLVLAHACAGIDVSSKEYVEGIQTALDAVAHHLTDH